MVFANLSYQDKQAFFSLLDEYFESRPHLLGQRSSSPTKNHQEALNSAVGGAVIGAATQQFRASFSRHEPSPPPTSSGGPPPIDSGSRPGRGPAPPPPVPVRTPSDRTLNVSAGAGSGVDTAGSPPPSTPSQDSQSGSVASRVKSFGNTGMNKVAGNSHISGALKKVGAGGALDRFNKPNYSTTYSAGGGSSDGPRTMPPPPPGSSAALPPPTRSVPVRKAGEPVGGLTSGKSFGHVDTESGGSTFKTMWRDPQKVEPATANVRQTPALGTPSRGLPPPTRRDGVGHSGASSRGFPQAQALYDYEGGDDTDLPVHENQVVSIIAKTSADWWTCEDDSGKQGLVPANYMKEL